MDLLKRDLAPILPEAWKLIDEEARRVLKLNLAGRKIVDFSGPHGWAYAAVNTGRLAIVSEQPVAEVSVGLRTVQQLVEIRTPIVLDTMELDTVGRGAQDPDLDPVVRAAERIARTEDGAIFNGYEAAGIAGIIDSSPHPPILVGATAQWPAAVARGLEVLKSAGIDGPYTLAAGTRAFDQLSAGSEEGYPLRKRVEQQVGAAIVWAPAVEGAVLLSSRGGDYELTVGQDLSIGYAFREKHQVELFLTESFTFRVFEPAAAVAIRHGA